VEYCGIDFDALDNLPEDLTTVANEVFSGNSGIQEKILDCRKRWGIGGLKQVLSLLSKKQFDEVFKVMSEMDCFKKDAPNQHVAKRLDLLQAGIKAHFDFRGTDFDFS